MDTIVKWFVWLPNKRNRKYWYCNYYDYKQPIFISDKTPFI